MMMFKPAKGAIVTAEERDEVPKLMARYDFVSRDPDLKSAFVFDLREDPMEAVMDKLMLKYLHSPKGRRPPFLMMRATCKAMRAEVDTRLKNVMGNVMQLLQKAFRTGATFADMAAARDLCLKYHLPIARVMTQVAELGTYSTMSALSFFRVRANKEPHDRPRTLHEVAEEMQREQEYRMSRKRRFQRG